MEILSFKISGKMAHFRKYYANNTAFSFTIPPRTTLMGIVAAAMGWPKDSYYSKLASEHIQLGVRVLSPLKKSFHRLNFLSVKSIGDMSKKWTSDLRGENGRIQTPFEVVTGLNITQDEVAYQIFMKPTGAESEIFELIKNHFLYKQPVYSITLGTANFTAHLSDIKIFSDTELCESESSDYILIHSAVPTEYVEDLKFHKEEFDSYNFVEEDMLPGDFVADQNREVRKMNKLLFSTTSIPLRVKLKGSFFQIKTEEEVLNIQFMDL